MSKFKVGDWVKKETWDYFYEVVAVRPNKIQVIVISGIAWYDLTEHVFIKKEETMKLELGGKYRKVGTHEPVRVICTDRVSSDVSKEFTCVSLVRTKEDFEYMSVTTAEGKDLLGEILFEKVPEIDWSNVPIDTPIWVGKEPRHFAGFSSHTEEVFYYSSGTTSHTSRNMRYGFSPQFSTHKSNCSLENPNA